MIRILHQRLKRPRGLTFIEMMISVGIISVVMAFLVYITLLQSYKSNHIATMSRAETRVRNVAEFIRYRVVMGQFGSLSISNNNRTLTFVDPTNGSSVTSSFTFNPNNGQLVYDDNTSAGAAEYRVFQGLHEVNFTTQNNGAMLQATITAQASPYTTKNPRPVYDVQQTMKVFLRN